MAKGFVLNDKRFKKDIKKATRFFTKTFPKKVYEEFKDNTPIDGGNARRKTKLRKTSQGSEIKADYDYSGVIDKGLYGKPPGSANGPKTRKGYSTQAPKGIVDPTLEYAEELADAFLRRL